ncbi:MAG TPA: hypothetical protein VJP80_07120 [Candidatus Saccharimonadales bacterium]|nr:hypothetical protein [Candidatus Saccharimonadales bacterium]
MIRAESLTKPRVVAPVMLLATLALAGCFSNKSPSAPPTEAPQVATTLCPPLSDRSVPSAPPGQHMLRFDALGGGNCIIEVYPGVADTPADHQYDGTYASGQTALTNCVVLNGRLVRSHPEVREKDEHSTVWYRLVTPPGTPDQYATAVYADAPNPASMPICPPVVRAAS